MLMFNYKVQEVTYLFAAFTKLLCLPFYVSVHFNFILPQYCLLTQTCFALCERKTYQSKSESCIMIAFCFVVFAI
jgi:hypothetical protein